MTDHLLKLTDHRDRDLLELTLSKAILDYCRYSVSWWPGDGRRRAKALAGSHPTGCQRWWQGGRSAARGSPDTATSDDAPDRTRCLQSGEVVEIAWAGEKGPRITMLPLFSDSRSNDEGVIEIHSDMPLLRCSEDGGTASPCLPEYVQLAEYSDRDALTGLLNRNRWTTPFTVRFWKSWMASWVDWKRGGPVRIRHRTTLIGCRPTIGLAPCASTTFSRSMTSLAHHG